MTPYIQFIHSSRHRFSTNQLDSRLTQRASIQSNHLQPPRAIKLCSRTCPRPTEFTPIRAATLPCALCATGYSNDLRARALHQRATSARLLRAHGSYNLKPTLTQTDKLEIAPIPPHILTPQVMVAKFWTKLCDSNLNWRHRTTLTATSARIPRACGSSPNSHL